MNTNSYIASSPRTIAFSSANSGSVISVRTSDQAYRSIGSGSAASGGAQAVTSFNAYAVKKTASFTAIHSDVSGLQSPLIPQPRLYTDAQSGAGGGREDKPGTPMTPTGQLQPVGDMLLPMLVMTVAYIVIKIFRNYKTYKAL